MSFIIIVWIKPGGAGDSGSITVKKQKTLVFFWLSFGPPLCHKRELYTVTVPFSTSRGTTPLDFTTPAWSISGRPEGASGRWLPGNTSSEALFFGLANPLAL